MTKNQIAFQAEVKRLEKIANKLLKQGFIFTEPPIPEMPKRVTQKQLRIIKSISPREIKSKAELPTNENAISAYTPIKAEPSKRRKKQNTKSKYKTKRKRTSKKKATFEFQTEQETDKSTPFTEARRNLQIARDILHRAIGEENAVGRATMEQMLDNAIAELGENVVAKRLERIADFQSKFELSIYASTQEQVMVMHQYQIMIYEGIYNTVLSPDEIDSIEYGEIEITGVQEFRHNKYIDDDETTLKGW